MCGIAGLVSLGGQLTGDSRATAAAMASTMAHRGPDGDGLWIDAWVAFAHRRLAIIDVSDAGAQPMTSSNGRFVITFNGEIYNFGDLGRRLRAEGWHSLGGSDTEVLLGAIEAWGLQSALERADGMFAFALYDRRERTVMLARDRFGEKPLAYCVHGGRLVFASDLRAFATVQGMDMSLDVDATADYFRYGYVTGTRTIYAGITRVPPATVVQFDLTTGTRAQDVTYWMMPLPQGRAEPGGPPVEDLEQTLSSSVRRRLVSDRPIGAFLSGGIDSSLVCALAAEASTGPLKTFTMGWEDTEYDESKQAAAVASALGTDHHEIRLGRQDVVTSVERLASVMDEPFADSSQLAVLLVATRARELVAVALSGDGADELFAGYNRHRWLLSSERVRRLPHRLRQPSAALLRSGAPWIQRGLRPIPMSRRPRLVGDKVRKWADVVAAASLEEAYQVLLAHDPHQGVPRELACAVKSRLSSADRDDVQWALRVADLTGYMVDDILVKVDRATMAVSLESRTPYLQPDVAALAARMGSAELVGKSGGKQPLRALLRSYLPTVDFDVPKSGFGVPIPSLLRTELRTRLNDAIASHRSRRPPLTIDWATLAEARAHVVVAADVRALGRQRSA